MRLRDGSRVCLIAALAASSTALVYATLAGAQSILPVLTSAVPGDVDTRRVRETQAAMEAAFDDFSWRSLVALSWPARGDGSPDPARRIGERGDAPTVWEQWPQAEEVFPTPAARPRAWGTPPVTPASCGTGARVLSMFTKAPATPSGVVQEFSQALNTGPLIDRNGVYVRYSVQLNRDAFDYIVGNRLYDTAVQASFGRIAFPAGTLAARPVGAITIKAAWKVLGAGDDPDRFHRMSGWAYTPAAGPDPESCVPREFGLVGFHIAHKTQSRPQWIWSTFEHIDNAPPANAPRSSSFFDVNCKGPDCTPNIALPPPWHPAAKGVPTQVTRVTPMAQGTAAVNTRWQAALRAVDARSPWQYYMLVGTQWPTMPENGGLGAPTPPTLVNAVLETFIQQGGRTSSSCMYCHNGATVAGKSSRPADFTYLLQRAAPAASR